jgi:hypothetical protein
MQFEAVLNKSLLPGVAVATSGMIFVPPIYYLWKLVASFRQKSIPHWPPAVCLSLWLLQWPFFILLAVGCLGGGCDDNPARDWLGLVSTLAYNSVPAYWLWRRSTAKSPNR